MADLLKRGQSHVTRLLAIKQVVAKCTLVNKETELAAQQEVSHTLIGTTNVLKSNMFPTRDER